MVLASSRVLVLLVLAVVISVIFLAPAQACLWTGGWLSPDEPFDVAYFDEGQIVFRGRPTEIHFPKVDIRTTHENSVEADFQNGSEVAFEVFATYRGEERGTWTAYQLGSALGEARNLETFKKEVGGDLLVVLSEPDEFSKEFTQLPMIALGDCGELLMRRFSLMEPLLRSKGLIN